MCPCICHRRTPTRLVCEAFKRVFGNDRESVFMVGKKLKQIMWEDRWYLWRLFMKIICVYVMLIPWKTDAGVIVLCFFLNLRHIDKLSIMFITSYPLVSRGQMCLRYICGRLVWFELILPPSIQHHSEDILSDALLHHYLTLHLFQSVKEHDISSISLFDVIHVLLNFSWEALS